VRPTCYHFATQLLSTKLDRAASSKADQFFRPKIGDSAVGLLRILDSRFAQKSFRMQIWGFPWIVKHLVRKNVGNFRQIPRYCKDLAITSLVHKSCVRYTSFRVLAPGFGSVLRACPEKNIPSVTDRRIAAGERTCAH
jgi:hypothetical protein